MKYIPILFKPHMVTAILKLWKTQTRRRLSDDYQVGDILWVKERHYAYGEWIRNGLTKTGKQAWKFVRDRSKPILFEEPEDLHRIPKNRDRGYYVRSSLYHEKADCRLHLEITNIRHEKLQDISSLDAIREGINRCEIFGEYSYKDYLADASEYGHPDHDFPTLHDPIDSFQTLWDSINGDGPGAWKFNPTVIALDFKICHPTS